MGVLPGPRTSAETRGREQTAPGGVLTDRDAPAFDVHLDNFSGPFDLLLGLISRRRLEITEVALAEVTDEFIGHLRRMLAEEDEQDDQDDQDDDGGPARPTTTTQAALGQASGFLVVAATLLDLKAARLLPAEEGEEPDADDLALVEARDLLFARLLQHRAYARVGALLAERLELGSLAVPRPGGAGAPDPQVQRVLPELVVTTTPAELAALAAAALLAPGRLPERVDVEHLHAPEVSLPEQVALVREQLLARHAAAPGQAVSFADLLGGHGGRDVAATGGPVVAVVVGRFLAVLELYRRGELDLAQEHPGRPLLVRWLAPAVVDLRDVS